jgi:L-seryl-tRNA(Ser) seleniumtransferase
LLVDLGSGALVDLQRYGLPPEPTVRKIVAAGADVVMFSGDKLLGGPQAGILVGRKDLIAKINKNPLKRALRCDKLTIAALLATLRLYDDVESLPMKLPALRLLARPLSDIQAAAERLAPVVQHYVGNNVAVTTGACDSEIGSGAAPGTTVSSWGLMLKPRTPGRGIAALAKMFRDLPVPVLGRVSRDCLTFDLRCLEDEASFLAQINSAAS